MQILVRDQILVQLFRGEGSLFFFVEIVKVVMDFGLHGD